MLRSVLLDLEDGAADGRPTVPLPDSVLNPAGVRAMMAAQGRTGGLLFEDWDPHGHPFSPFEGTPEFDLADDAFQEIVMSGALQILRDRTLRVELLRYYRTAEDMGENERREALYQTRLEEALGWVGVAVGDSIGLVDLAGRLAEDPRVRPIVRRSVSNLRQQARFLGLIDDARRRLEAVRAEGQRAAS